MKVVVTIPAYNEEKTIGQLISGIKRVMSSTKYNYEVLVVDDGSRDRTADIARNAGAVVYSHPMNYGLAETFRTELQQCLKLGADTIVHIDADCQYLPEDIPKLLKEIENGYDLVLGSRFKGRIEYMPFVNRIGNKAFSMVISNITRTRITDAQTGFRAFTRKVAEEIRLTSDHTYTQEQIIRAIKQKFRIIEVPVYFARRRGRSRLIKNPLGYAFRAWINILRVYRDYEPLKFFGLIGIFIMSIGTVIGLYLVYLHFTSGIVGHFPLIMLCVLVLSVGLQILLFGFMADMERK